MRRGVSAAALIAAPWRRRRSTRSGPGENGNILARRAARGVLCSAMQPGVVQHVQCNLVLFRRLLFLSPLSSVDYHAPVRWCDD